MSTYFDETLIPHLKKVMVEDYEYLKPTKIAEQKKHFFDTGTVLLTYPQVEHRNFPALLEDYNIFQHEVELASMPEAAKQLYRNKLTEHKYTFNMLRATKQGDDLRFNEEVNKVYRPIESRAYWSVVENINDQFTAFKNKVLDEYPGLQADFDNWDIFYTSLNRPRNFTPIHTFNYPGIYIENNNEIDSSICIYELFANYLEENGVSDWEIIIADPGERIAFGVNQTTKTIHIPHDTDLQLRKKNLTRKYLLALLEHEVGVHVVRRENGEKSPLYLLATGLGGYLYGEEGVATFAEQLITGATDLAGEYGHFAIGTALGLGGVPKNLPELFPIMYTYAFLRQASRQYAEDGFCELDEIKMSADSSAWTSCIRVFRGTTGNTRGAVFTRDLCYLEGNQAIWCLADQANPSVNPEWLKGKYDPANDTHVTLLKELEILSL